MNLIRKLTSPPKKIVINSKHKIGDLVLVFGSWEGTIIGVQKGKIESTSFGNKRIETNKFFYKIKYRHEWMSRIKMCIGLYEDNCFIRRESIWK